jgi:hypothetical protein
MSLSQIKFRMETADELVDDSRRSSTYEAKKIRLLEAIFHEFRAQTHLMVREQEIEGWE